MINKKLPAIVSTILILCILLTFIGCGERKDTGAKQTENEIEKTASEGTIAQSESYIVKEKLTLKIVTDEWAGASVGNDMPVFQELEKRTNIHLDFELLPLTNPIERFNIIMASGDLPDIVSGVSSDLILKYGYEGVLIPLQDLIKEHAPNIKRSFEEPLSGDTLPYRLNTWREMTALDGNIYSIPTFASANTPGPVYAIRTDWLENLGLGIPETTDDFYTVLKQFKEEDPNRNGEKDEIPFVATTGGKTGTILPVINAFGAHLNLYIDSATDTIKYGPIEENYKEGLQFLNKLYLEELLEQDYLTSTRDQWMATAGGNKAGFMFGWAGDAIGNANALLQQLNKEYKFEPMLPIKGKKGDRFKDTSISGNYINYRASITRANKYPVETMKYFDYCFTDESTILCNYGLEGIHYNIVDGKPVFTEYVTKNPDGIAPFTVLFKDGGCWTHLPYERGWKPCYPLFDNAPWTKAVFDLYKQPGINEPPLPNLQLTEEELSRKNQILTEINTYKEPMVDKFIMGIESLDKFDEYANQIKRMNIDELLKILNDAYDRYKKF
jgi:putative aldouronate transport system substrate-binding protein